MYQVTIRSYKDSDQQAIWELNLLGLKQMGVPLNDLSHEQDLKDINATYINSGGEFLVGEHENKLVVMGALARYSKDIALMKRMRVHPNFQRQGVGNEILNELEKRVGSLEFIEIQLDTLAQNKSAQSFYIKNGYEEFKREIRWGFERVFYKKIL